MSCDITVHYVNDVHVRVECQEVSTARELGDFFTFTVPNARFIPAFRNKMWDGKIRLYNMYNQILYYGLAQYVVKFAEERNYTIKFVGNFPNLDLVVHTPSTTLKFLDSLDIHSRGVKIEPMEHQIEGVTHALKHRRCLLLSPTASGKSLIIYGMVRWLNSQKNAKKTLIVVPTVGLVEQMTSDFRDYSSENGWDADAHVHKITAGEAKTTDKDVICSTWQSIYQLPKSYFSQFGAVFIDEAHHMKADSLKGIMEKLEECPVRIGLTGTLDGMKTNKFVVEGLTGKVHRIAYTKDLIDADILSKLQIDCLTLKYPDAERKLVKTMKYMDEIQYLISHDRRNNFITDLAIHTKGNTLILFQYVETHGKVLHRLLEDKLKGTNRPLFYVSGETEAELREMIRQMTEKADNAIIVASYGTFSTGINIRKLHNIIFASPSKGRIRVLQSIGRQLRKSDAKEKAKLFDISDDLSWKSYQNYSLKHLIERLKIYNEEKFDYKLVSIKV